MCVMFGFKSHVIAISSVLSAYACVCLCMWQCDQQPASLCRHWIDTKSRAPKKKNQRVLWNRYWSAAHLHSAHVTREHTHIHIRGSYLVCDDDEPGAINNAMPPPSRPIIFLFSCSTRSLFTRLTHVDTHRHIHWAILHPREYVLKVTENIIKVRSTHTSEHAHTWMQSHFNSDHILRVYIRALIHTHTQPPTRTHMTNVRTRAKLHRFTRL